MPWPDQGGYPYDALNGVARPDAGGFASIPPPRFSTYSGPDAGGQPTAVGGLYAGVFGNNPPVDGPTWSASTLPSAASSNIIAYGNGVTCTAVGSVGNANLLRSADFGRTWTLLALPVSGEWKSIATDGKGTWVVLAGNNTASQTAIVSKDNGLRWFQNNMPVSQLWYACEWGNGVFIALGFGSASAYISPDGLNWTLVSMPAASNWRSLAFGNGTWVAVADTGSPAISLDGKTWAAGGAGPLTANPIRFGGNIFFVVSGTTFWTTRDGKSWNSPTLPVSCFQADYTDGLWAAFSQSTGQVCVSSHAEDPNGSSWAIAKNLLPASTFYAVRAGPPRTIIGVQSLATGAFTGIF